MVHVDGGLGGSGRPLFAWLLGNRGGRAHNSGRRLQAPSAFRQHGGQQDLVLALVLGQFLGDYHRCRDGTWRGLVATSTNAATILPLGGGHAAAGLGEMLVLGGEVLQVVPLGLHLKVSLGGHCKALEIWHGGWKHHVVRWRRVDQVDDVVIPRAVQMRRDRCGGLDGTLWGGHR